jgi:hypothetical protein
VAAGAAEAPVEGEVFLRAGMIARKFAT